MFELYDIFDDNEINIILLCIFVFILVSLFYSFPADIELSLIFTIIFIISIILLLWIVSFKKKLIIFFSWYF